MQEYPSPFREPDGLTGTLNWYRGALDGLIQPEEKVTTPTLFIWARHDPVTSGLAVELQQGYMAGSFKVTKIDGGHWIMETHTETVVEAVMSQIDEKLFE